MEKEKHENWEIHGVKFGELDEYTFLEHLSTYVEDALDETLDAREMSKIVYEFVIKRMRYLEAMVRSGEKNLDSPNVNLNSDDPDMYAIGTLRLALKRCYDDVLRIKRSIKCNAKDIQKADSMFFPLQLLTLSLIADLSRIDNILGKDERDSSGGEANDKNQNL